MQNFHIFSLPNPQLPLLLTYWCGTSYYNGLTGFDTLLLTKGHSVHEGSLFVPCGFMSFAKSVSYAHHYSIKQNTFTILKTPSTLLHSSARSSSNHGTTDLFPVSIVLPFLECHVARIRYFTAFFNEVSLISSFTEGSSMSFCDLIAHFFLSLNINPLYGSTTICLSIQTYWRIFWLLPSFNSYE